MREYTFEHERKEWRKESGPWDNEPDKRIWTDAATGLPCLIVRNYSGALCGYVGVPSSHPWFKQPYNQLEVEVHGDLTYSDTREDEATWWVGFDCAHAFDLVPYRPWGTNEGDYRNIDYVTKQCEKLAMQAHKANLFREVSDEEAQDAMLSGWLR